MAGSGIQATAMRAQAGSVTDGMSAFGTELARLMQARGLGFASSPARCGQSGHISNLRSGKAQLSAGLAADLNKISPPGSCHPHHRSWTNR
jgi:hypothetical protein